MAEYPEINTEVLCYVIPHYAHIPSFKGEVVRRIMIWTGKKWINARPADKFSMSGKKVAAWVYI